MARVLTLIFLKKSRYFWTRNEMIASAWAKNGLSVLFKGFYNLFNVNG